MIDLDITLPSIRHIHSLIRDQQTSEHPRTVEVKLLTGDVITGTVKWIDIHCMCMDGANVDGGEKGKSHVMLIWHHAIAFIRS